MEFPETKTTVLKIPLLTKNSFVFFFGQLILHHLNKLIASRLINPEVKKKKSPLVYIIVKTGS